MKILFQGAVIIGHNAAISNPCDILVEEGIIRQIADKIDAPDAELVDCHGMVLSPGLPNLHTHSPMHMLRGLAEDVAIEDWFNQQIWPYESKITEEDIYWGSMMACAEMIDNGVTAFADHYFSAQTIVKAAIRSGLRLDLAVTAFGLDVEKDIADTLALREQYQNSQTVNIRFGPHSPYLVAPDSLRKLTDAAKAAGTGIHIHASETELQEQQSIEKYGKRHFQIIAEAGGFDVPCIIAHGLWANEDDFQLVGRETFVAACPKTYLKLGAGKGLLWENWKAKNLCIGTDGAASSNSVRPLEQAQYFALCGKWEGRAADFRAEDIWRMLMNGHNALPFGTGKIAEGAPADLVVWNLNAPATGPVYSPIASILYSAGAQQVVHTMVAGKFLKKDGQVLLDMDELCTNASRCAKDLYERGKGEAIVHF
ncbi:amidohydrolase family protein [Oscillospiraceae bacterium MB08-C2-2]|nr:amidohydrolase family protein [Oscillospiraceae bacterium MB08-C2-2]